MSLSFSYCGEQEAELEGPLLPPEQKGHYIPPASATNNTSKLFCLCCSKVSQSFISKRRFYLKNLHAIILCLTENVWKGLA